MLATAVTDEELGRFHCLVRELESRLGKSASIPRVMDVLQAMIDNEEGFDVRSRVKKMSDEGLVTPSTALGAASHIPDVDDKRLCDLIGSNPNLTLDQSAIDFFGTGVLGRLIGVVPSVHWYQSEVAIDDTHDAMLRDHPVDPESAYGLEQYHMFLFHLSALISLQSVEDFNDNQYFLTHTCTCFYLLDADLDPVALELVPQKNGIEVNYTLYCVGRDKLVPKRTELYRVHF